MELINKAYCEVDMSDVTNIAGQENYIILVKWMKENIHYATKQPCGGGCFDFHLNPFLPEEDEEMIEDNFDEDYCPFVVGKIIDAITKHAKESPAFSHFKKLQVHYRMDCWT